MHWSDWINGQRRWRLTPTMRSCADVKADKKSTARLSVLHLLTRICIAYKENWRLHTYKANMNISVLTIYFLTYIRKTARPSTNHDWPVPWSQLSTHIPTRHQQKNNRDRKIPDKNWDVGRLTSLSLDTKIPAHRALINFILVSHILFVQSRR